MPRLLGHKTVTVLRLLGTSQMSSDARGLLKSICFQCGNPGRLRLAFEEARKWASFTVPAPLASTAEEATHQLCARLEQTHGRLLVAHVLGYIASSR
ncbi:hypothetical protein P7K49_033519, partial [Saguinus oedipus]